MRVKSMIIQRKKCLSCGCHEPENTMNNGICEYCVDEKKLIDKNKLLEQNQHPVKNKNRYLLLGFFEFAILSTLMVVFFPWSLLFCLFFYGMEETKLIVIALFHDFLKTIIVVILVAFFVFAIISFFLVTR
jgi:ABC-type multidrug transport system permease subunit